MIELHQVSYAIGTGRRRRSILQGLSLRFPPRGAVALLGRNGAGKSTLLKIIAGSLLPSSGRVVRRGRVSWPVGFGGALHPDLTGAQNTAFVARLYGLRPRALCAHVAAFSQLGADFERPVRGYSTGMRARLAFAISMGVPFDMLLIDEVAAVGDGAFRETCKAALAARLETASAIVVSHSPELIRKLCRTGIVLEGGRATIFDDVEAALTHHHARLEHPAAAHVAAGCQARAVAA